MDSAPEAPRASSERRLAFGSFELVPATGELFRGGERVALQPQPAELLALLAERAGGAVSREEIRDRIWGPDTFVDHDQSINYCVRQIRHALDDDPAAPRFVETVPRHGYRFVATVEERGIAPLPSPVGGTLEAAPAEPPRRGLGKRLALAALGLATAGFAIWLATASEGLGDGDDGAPGERSTTVAGDTARPPRQIVVPEDAHSRFLRARYLLERAEPSEHVAASTEAIELLQSVVAEVPRHAEAHAVLADAWIMRYDLPRPEALRRAGETARRALELDPDLSLAHTALATSDFFLHLDWESAEEHVARALELEPDNPHALYFSAVVHSTRGRHEQAIAAARRTVELEPAQLAGIAVGWFYYMAGRFEEALGEGRRVLELAPADEPNHKVVVLSHLALGNDAAADAEIERFYRLHFEIPDGEPAGLPPVRELYRARGEAGHREVPEEAVTVLVPATQAALAGEHEAAIDHLLHECRERTAAGYLPFVAVDPRWRELRELERFQEVLDCVGVPGQARVRIAGNDR